REVPPGPRDNRDRQWAARETGILSPRKFVLSASDPLHWRCAWFCHRRSEADSRLGGPFLSRLVFAIARAAAPFHPATLECARIAVVDFEIRREVAALKGERRKAKVESRNEKLFFQFSSNGCED